MWKLEKSVVKFVQKFEKSLLKEVMVLIQLEGVGFVVG